MTECELTPVSKYSGILFGISHLIFFIHFTRVHASILKTQLKRSPRDIVTNKVPFRILYVLNVYSYYAALNAGLTVTKGLRLTNALHVATSDGHCISIVDWIDWYFHSLIDLSTIMWILSVNFSSKKIVLQCAVSMLTCGLVCELTDQLAVQIPFFFLGAIFFVMIFSHLIMFYRARNFFNSKITGLVQGMIAIVCFVWSLYPIMFILLNVVWRDRFDLSVRDTCITSLYIISKFGFNILFLAWDSRFQMLISMKPVPDCERGRGVVPHNQARHTVHHQNPDSDGHDHDHDHDSHDHDLDPRDDLSDLAAAEVPGERRNSTSSQPSQSSASQLTGPSHLDVTLVAL